MTPVRLRSSDGLRWTNQGYARRDTTRDPALWPFTTNSPWNLPIATGATFETATGTVTTDLIRTSGINTWINQASYSHSLTFASEADPVATVTDNNYSVRSAVYKIPPTAPIASGLDRHMHVLDPQHRYVNETIGVNRFSPTSYSCSRHAVSDPYGTGLGPNAGVRAYGGSAIGGLIRAWEIDPTHPRYTGVIMHTLALALDPSQMKYTGGGGGYDSSFYGLSLGYVWPATEQDSSANSAYKGKVPMGTYCAIPGTVNLGSLGLASAGGMMIARALQDYGAYVTDTTGFTFAFYVEETADPNWRGGILATSDLNKLRAQLRAVTNNSVSTPNGGTLGTTRRAALAPALPAIPVG